VFRGLCLGLSGSYIANTNFPTKQDNLNDRKLVLLHTLVLSQTISGSQHLFGAIRSVTKNSVFILLHADMLLFA